MTEGGETFYQYLAIVIDADGVQRIKTEFSDWYRNDTEAEKGFRRDLEEQGYSVCSVVIGDPITTVYLATPEEGAVDKLLRARLMALTGIRDAISKLPRFTAASECCGACDIRYIEDGYQRACSVRAEDKAIIVQTDGFDDYSEDGEFSYMECLNCRQLWNTPEIIDWE
jgi:hypothetical protein